MDKLNELIDFYEMTEDEPELLVMLLELRRHRQENWKQRAEAAWAEAKHQLGVNVVLSHHNQAIVEQRDKALTQLSELAKQEPDYFLNRIESSDKWGPETDLRIYESQLGASKSQDDHGGGIIELFTRPAPAAVPDGWKLVPAEPTKKMHDAYYEHSVAPISKLSVTAYRAMLEAAPEPPSC